MTALFVTAALAALVLGMIELKRAWTGARRSSALLACSGLLVSILLFCAAWGAGLGIVFGLCMIGVAGLAASALSAELQPPKRLARSSPRVRPRLAAAERLAKGWRFLLCVPVALSAGLALGLAALSVVPGAAADRLVTCTLVAVSGAAVLVGWTAADPRLWRSTLIGSGSLAAGLAAAMILA
ncbi:MAG TPA: hypothetical protein VFG91_06945 [Woeseiaceae bacterium]|nr:hypothetical protein [Woeseiaceae bacterium]